MNNANAGPWWFTAVVAGITAFTALITGLFTAWITNKHASRRANADLYNTRAQFEKQWTSQREQFDEQMSAQREIERRKLVHDSRQKIYFELCDAFNAATTKVTAMSFEVEGKGEVDHEFKIYPEASTELRTLQRLAIECRIIASESVRAHAHNMAFHLKELNKAYFTAMSMQNRSLDLIAMWKPLKDEFDTMTAAMRRDLGVVE
jgi:hypothetical protein